ncbi:unnamed protein product [Moneuplotes crassus]|uniref:Uncharacterized protein n=1 Tax=Euplotes crassus TaxID=5936 RepID=A0AAD1XVJ4_EUPCR|nr:unnamed protein product [Moneuplotes crassus]
MESSEVKATTSSAVMPKNSTNEDEDDFEVEEVATTTQKLENLDINKDNDQKKELATKAKLTKSSRAFKPKVKEKAKLANKGRTFKPSKPTDEEQKAYHYQDTYQQYQDYGSGYNEGAPDYYHGASEDDDLENDFAQFQYENEQLELIKDNVGEFGEGLIRFEESSRNCQCCQGLVERCDGDICQSLGECYCISHKKYS